MNFDEFIATLPSSITRGYHYPLPDNVIKKLFLLADLGKRDIFYDLGCGDGRSLEIAATEFGVRKAVGVESNLELAQAAVERCKKIMKTRVIKDDLLKVDLSVATIVLVRYADSELTQRTERKLKRELADGGRVITIWSPFGLTIPDKIDFPFFVTKKPFCRARSLRDQIKSVYGQRCIDFTAAWLLAERYIDQLETVKTEYRRFVTILQSLVIWINAWKMRVACEEEIPPPVHTYLGIMKTFFDVDLSNLLDKY